MAELFDIPIENINTGVPATPANPFQVDPAQASMAYITAMSDPAFMSKLLGAEQQYRPQFTGLTLQEIEQSLRSCRLIPKCLLSLRLHGRWVERGIPLKTLRRLLAIHAFLVM
jgi:hypothetical protein